VYFWGTHAGAELDLLLVRQGRRLGLEKLVLPFNQPVTEIIRQRYSCRAYTKAPIAPEQAEQLARCAA